MFASPADIYRVRAERRRAELLEAVRGMTDGERMELLHLLQAGEERVKSNQSEKVSARKC